MKTRPPDRRERERFATELDHNFSVIAAAGAGKTSAIIDRIAQIGQDRERASEWFPRLVVVTFTNRAADEMQQRARQRIFQANVSPDVLAAFNRAFFGTIHSFCMKLLRGNGQDIGLPSRLELITDDSDLWNDFVQRTDSLGHSLSTQNRKALFRHVQVRDLMELGRRGKLPLAFEQPEISCPQISKLERLYHYRTRPNANRIQALQKALREWEERLNSGADFLPLIECTAEGRFRQLWEDAFGQFREWLTCCALAVAAEVQRAYRQFRAAHGVVTFDDQIALALELTKNPAAISRIRGKDYIVILDEAQDTDPQQFEILLEITRPLQASGRWLDELRHPPRPGRFCMVGDFQQSIYGDRADLKHYRQIHNAIVRTGAGEESKFSVTFRLDSAQLAFVNKCFREILTGIDGQVGLIELNPRPEVLPGQVIRLDIVPATLEVDPSEAELAKSEADQLALWMAQNGCDKLRARSWSEVAILCPRKKWFRPIADALRRVGIDFQIQSETDVKGDSPAHAWFTAVLTIMTQPRLGFEIVGVLREVFGMSDHDLASYCDGTGDRFQIETPPDQNTMPSRGTVREPNMLEASSSVGRVADTLQFLARLHAEIAGKPLFSAVALIVEAISLPERLRLLPAEEFDDLQAELDVLLESAAAAEAEGLSLEEFADLLGANFGTEREAKAPRPGAIQLITCQKAKGLEWDAVIVPFFSRRIHTSEDDFPRIVTAPHSGQPIVAFSKGDVPVETRKELKKAEAQEMERLLYVALTRARHTLVLGVDRELYGAAPSASLTTWLRSDQGQLNQEHVSSLSSAASGCRFTRAAQLAKMPKQTANEKLAPLPEALLPAGRRRGAEFPRRYFPSSFTPTESDTGFDKRKESESEFRAKTVPSAATRYGIWWHELMQRIPWNANRGAWERVFQRMLPNSPDQSRSVREWELLRRNLSSASDFIPLQAIERLILRSEMPFLWSASERQCLEGIIDLALFEPGKNRWFILDWKTNQVMPDEVDKLRAHYRPQLAAYWKAVGEISRNNVEAAIYSTAAGALICYHQDELEAEWNRLLELPPDEIVATVADQERGTAKQLDFADFC